jgi:choline dehydrogenase-like flavoprotein
LRFSSQVPAASTDDLQIYVTDYVGNTLLFGALMMALMDPTSTGRLSLRSPDPTVEPEVAFRMLADRADVVRLAVGLREAERVLANAAFAPVLDGPARWPTGLRTDDVEGVELSTLRMNCRSYNHATGTCRMGAASAPDTVVDEHGSVLGVEGLSVADASVMPRIVRAPTHLTTVMIAERIAQSLKSA